MDSLSTNSGYFTTVKSGLFIRYSDSMENYDFAKRLKILKEEFCSDMTQEEFAKWAGYSKSIISEWLRGEKVPSMNTALDLCDKFNVNLNWLMRGVDPKRESDTFINNHEPIDFIYRLNDDNYNLVKNLAEKLVKYQSEQF